MLRLDKQLERMAAEDAASEPVEPLAAQDTKDEAATR
jgi:hypothetical protein